MNRLVFVLFFCVLSAFVKAQAVHPLFGCSERMNNPYGFFADVMRPSPKYDYGFMKQELAMMKNAGAGNLRCDIYYNTINTTHSGILDEVMSNTLRDGIDYLGIAFDPELYKKTWIDNAQFQSYLFLLNNNYIDRIKYLEFFNEVNIAHKIVSLIIT